MRQRIVNLTQTELIKYNIIQLCLNIHKENASANDIVKFLQLNKLTGISGLGNSVKKVIKDAKGTKGTKGTKLTKLKKKSSTKLYKK